MKRIVQATDAISIAGGGGPMWLACLSMMGVHVLVAAETSELLAAVVALSGCSRVRAAPGAPAVRVSVRTRALPFGEREARIVSTHDHLEVVGAGAIARGTASGDAVVEVDPSRTLDAAFAAEFLEPCLLFLVTRRGRTPIHAAGFLHRDAAILLVGPSGSGKSCLSLAAYRAGHHLLSDDTVYVAQEDGLRLYGRPGPIHLFPKDAPAGIDLFRTRQGKTKCVVTLPSPSGPPVARQAIVMLLQRGEAVSLDRLTPDCARQSMPPLEPGFHLLGEAITAAWASLVQEGAWRLTLDSDPDAAIALVTDRLPQILGPTTAECA